MAKSEKIRLDEYLIRRGFADSLATAKAMIMCGDVVVDDQRVDKPGTLIKEGSVVRLKDEGRFVSRGGDKLEAAIVDNSLQASFSGKIVLDVGASTGGFTDCVLSHGAAHVIAIDVGTAQLSWRLRQDARVTSIEKTDVRLFDKSRHPNIDWVVADVSFTSLARLIPDIKRAAPGGSVLLLIKPQFELPREMVPKGGIVTDQADRLQALREVREALKDAGYVIKSEIDAKVAGKQGNREIFIYAVPSLNA
jgi:23S rRNA (cytidine1920-2'-O)/16S rRNA (cytidine1409-2'-O)-methyltransferase